MSGVDLVAATLAAAALLSVPYLFAALGGVTCERSGVVNIALEGLLLSGAFAAAAVSLATGSAWAGVLGAALAGVVTAALFAFFVLIVRIDQIIAGLAVNLFVAGGTRLGAELLWQQKHSPVMPDLASLWAQSENEGALAALARAVVGEPLTLVAIVALVAVVVLHRRTVLGLRLAAAGENPSATEAAGLSVLRLRATAILLSGALAGLGGAWLAFDVAQFSDGLSAGKGYIAMAAVVFGRWRPLAVAGACLLFGLLVAIAEALERGGALHIESEVVGALPYALTIVALVALARRAEAPAALGRPFDREQA